MQDLVCVDGSGKVTVLSRLRKVMLWVKYHPKGRVLMPEPEGLFTYRDITANFREYLDTAEPDAQYLRTRQR